MPSFFANILTIMKLYISYGNIVSKEWENLEEFELELLVNKDIISTDKNTIIGLKSQKVILPNDEAIEVSVSYSIINLGISIIVISENQTIINVGGFKSSEMSYDPSIIFLTPKGIHLSLMVGN